MRVLVFGASGVQGFWDSQGGWVLRLRSHYDSLQVKDLAKDYPRIMNLGMSGNTSADLLARLDNEAAARQNPKGLAIIFSVGTNNAAIRDGRPSSSTEKYEQELLSLIEKAKKYTSKIMLVGLHPVNETKTTPVAWGDIVFKNNNIWQFEQTMRDVCKEQKIDQVATFETLSQATAAGKEIHSDDGVHLNDEGHEQVSQLVRPVLDQLIAS
jgi:lysophospholipase L1-like esterase